MKGYKHDTDKISVVFLVKNFNSFLSSLCSTASYLMRNKASIIPCSPAFLSQPTQGATLSPEDGLLTN